MTLGDPNQLIQLIGLPLALFVLFYFLMIRPQQRRNRELQQMQASLGPGAERVEQAGERRDLVAIHLHQLQAGRARRHVHEGGLGERALAGAAHAPQQGVVVGQAAGEPLEVFQETRLLAVDAYQALQRQRIVRRGMEGAACGIVAEQPGGGDVERRRRRRGQPLQGFGDAGQHGLQVGVHAPDA